VFNDLGVIGTAGACRHEQPRHSGGWTGPSDPSTLFVDEYFNGARSNALAPDITTPIDVPRPSTGGNFIKPQFGPLTLFTDATTPDRLRDLNGTTTSSSARALATQRRMASAPTDGNTRPQEPPSTSAPTGASRRQACAATPVLKGLFDAIDLDQAIDAMVTE
jgi:hypothetical protein